MSDINSVAVIGAGVMGSGIAAHLANAGINVILLDIEKEFAEAGIARQIKANGFMDPAFAGRIMTGSKKNELALISNADWIIEAVAERLEVKQELYAAIDSARKPASIVSSNTSTIPLAALTSGLPNSFAEDFLITHFFNPPRSMRLFELVSGPLTKRTATATIQEFADRALGRVVVTCNDTPGFIANRIGNYWMIVAQNEAIAMGLDVEDVDGLLGRPFGIPATGIFGLLDLVGIDLMSTVLRSLQSALPATDAIQEYQAEPPLISKMIADGRLGRKSGAGFTRLSADRKSRETTDLRTGEYRPAKVVTQEVVGASREDLRAFLSRDEPGNRLARTVMQKTLAYAASLVPEIADGAHAVDDALRFGYGWKRGPFELIDHIGADWLVVQLELRGLQAPPFLSLAAAKGGYYGVSAERRRACLGPDGVVRSIDRGHDVITIADLKLKTDPVADYGTAVLWDIGDGVACLEFRTKMNTFSDALLDAIEGATNHVKEKFKALVIGSDSPIFSSGADLRVFLELVESGGAAALSDFLDRGQQIFCGLKYAPFPVVGAAAGFAVGGGCEILLHCDAIQAHAELAMGLVETKVGAIPGWGGCKEMLLRQTAASGQTRGPLAPAATVFDVITSAKVSASAFDARRLGFLRAEDGITMNRDRLLSDAKRKALMLVEGYAPPEPAVLSLSGPSGASALRNTMQSERMAGRATTHDEIIADALISVLSGGPEADPLKPVTEAQLLALEKQSFIRLFETSATIERVRHMLLTGKPLRN